MTAQLISQLMSQGIPWEQAQQLSQQFAAANLEQTNFKNLIDGGDFSVNPFQRNIPGLASSNTLAAAITGTTPTYFADRFFMAGSATCSIAPTLVADTTLAQFSQALKMLRSSADTHTAVLYCGQVLETADCIRLQGQQVTLSAWLKQGANYSGGALGVQLAYGTGTNQSAANLIAGSWTNQGNVITTSQGLSTTWTRYQWTGTVPANATQLGLLFSYTPSGTAGADDSVSFQGVQLELGAAATNFEHRDLQVETEICQRYCWVTPEPAAGVVVGMGACNSTTAAIVYMATPVQMRSAPTVTVSAGSFHGAPAGATASGTISAGATHTPNAITVNIGSLTTTTAGFGTPLVGGGASGYIVASSDF